MRNTSQLAPNVHTLAHTCSTVSDTGAANFEDSM